MFIFYKVQHDDIIFQYFGQNRGHVISNVRKRAGLYGIWRIIGVSHDFTQFWTQNGSIFGSKVLTFVFIFWITFWPHQIKIDHFWSKKLGSQKTESAVQTRNFEI